MRWVRAKELKLKLTFPFNVDAMVKIWCPPTPPQDDKDVYIDYSLAHLYDTQVMDEASLPPVYVPKELKRTRKESVHVPPDDGKLSGFLLSRGGS